MLRLQPSPPLSDRPGKLFQQPSLKESGRASPKTQMQTQEGPRSKKSERHGPLNCLLQWSCRDLIPNRHRGRGTDDRQRQTQRGLPRQTAQENAGRAAQKKREVRQRRRCPTGHHLQWTKARANVHDELLEIEHGYAITAIQLHRLLGARKTMPECDAGMQAD